MTLRIFLGYDPDEPVAYHVAAHSILRHASMPVAITPLVLGQLPMLRPRVPDQSTEFSFTRYLVPWLCDFKGRAIFMDSDILVRCDIAELWAAADESAKVSVVQHDYVPRAAVKFLGKTQTSYARKNWSSVMVFNCARCTELTPEAVNAADPAWLRQLHWAGDEIGSLPLTFNHLVGEYPPNPAAKIAHFTEGGPWFNEYRDCEFADEWFHELSLMKFPC